MDVPPLAGSAQAQASWQGGWEALRIKANLNSPELRLIAQEKLSTVIAKNAANPAAAATENAADLRIHQLQVQLDGALSALQLSLQGDWAQGGQHGRAQIQAQAKVQTTPSLQIGLHTNRAEFSMAEQNIPLAAGWQLVQAAPIALQWQAGRTQLAAGSLRLTAPQALRVGAQRNLLLQWQDSELVQAAGGGIARARSSGQLLGLSHTWLEALSGASLADMGLAGQILLDAHWDVRLDEHLAINASVRRQSGDFYLNEGKSYVTQHASTKSAPSPAAAPQQSAGLRDVYLRITGNDQQLRLQTLWDSARAGHVQADISSSLKRQGGSWTWPASSPIAGSLQADLPTLGLWSALAPTGWRATGKMALNANISGSRLAPDLRGQLQVQDLSMRSVLDGIELKNGQLQARFAGTRMELERFHIEGAEGDLSATGRLAWEAGQPSMDIQMQAKRLRASNRPDRRVTISGSVQAGLQGKRITLKGKLGIDEALILLADSSKPSLGTDVRIVRTRQIEQNATTVPSEAQLAAEEAAAQAAAQAALAPFTQQPQNSQWALDAAVALDMGADMRVRGMGLDTRLTGVLTIQTVSEQATSKGQIALRPEIVGILHTVGGEYRAYGQWLEIEDGIIRFTGPYSNPQLDILAIRPRTEERVGVRITGPASNPRVALYAENAMPDSEKLAWLILGREGSNGGAEAAMLQQAAVALLGSGSSGSGLAQSIGLDELGYRSAETNSDGTVRESSISIGKRLSRNLYLSYERSLSGALGTLYVFYDISRRFTLRAQTNEQASGLDLIFTRRYQGLVPAKRAALEAAAQRERQAEIDADTAHNNTKLIPEKTSP
jgi:translocation and assembly module TamB